MVRTREHDWRKNGFQLESRADASALTMATYIDNLYTASNSIPGAISIMEDAENYLKTKWKLTLKPSLKMVTSAAVGSSYIEDGKIGAFCY